MKYRNHLLLPFASCLTALAFFTSTATSRAVDIFLDIEGEIEGESQDDTHKDEIDVLAWSWGAANSGSFHQGGGGGSGRASFQDLSITKYVDKASAILLLHVANGDHFPKATLTVRTGSGNQAREFLVITMENVLITSVSTSGSGGDDRLTENVSLNFEKIEFKYTSEPKDGQEGVVKTFKWDIGANEPG